MKRSKSNLVPPAPPEPKRMTAEERRAYLKTLDLFRCFDFWFYGLQDVS